MVDKLPKQRTMADTPATNWVPYTLVDQDAQLATRAAWFYFVAGLTQAQIGKKLGINRVRVNRLLAEARAQGLVQISIHGKLADCVALEEALKQRFQLHDVVVVPTPPHNESIAEVIAVAAAQYLGTRLRDGMSIGVGWGRTLRLSLRSLPHRSLRKLSVVSLLGGLTRSAAVNPHETASHLADILEAECYYIAAPAMTDSAATRDVLMAQPMLREVFERGANVDLAYLSVGELSVNNTMARVGLISEQDVASLEKAGARGDLCVHWLDNRGQIIDHPLNDRAMALSPDRLKKIPDVIIASGGLGKVGVLHGVLHGGLVNVLITDEVTAHGVLRMAESLA
jgi:DNA-binding transcriptional regulator LsrR (DeoR family)